MHGHRHQIALGTAGGVDAAALGEDANHLHQGVAAVLLASVADCSAGIDAGHQHVADASHHGVASVAGDLDASRMTSGGAAFHNRSVSGDDLHGHIGEGFAAIDHCLHHVGG